jgi:DNA-binding response OmpR family regulator
MSPSDPRSSPCIVIWHSTGAAIMPTQEPKTILIVDDDRELNDGLRVVLEQQGYKTVQASNGHQAKEAVYRRRPHLVILDMMMPRMGGFPVLEHFRGKPDAPPIIMMTANEGKRHKAYAEFLGVIGYIRKPFAMEQLVECVQQILNVPSSTDDKADLKTSGE